MKLSVEASTLAKLLKTVERSVPKSSTLPVLSNILLRASADGLSAEGTNLEFGLRNQATANITENGAITIKPGLLADFANALPGGATINLTLDEEKMILQASSGKAEANIKGIDAEEFPVIPHPATDKGVSLDAETFFDTVNRVVFSAANADARPILTAAHMRLGNGELVLEAADGFRLSKVTAEVGYSGEKIEALIPASTLDELWRAVGGKFEGELKLELTPNQAIIKAGSLDWISQLIEGSFPNVDQIIPSTSTTKVEVARKELLSALSIVTPYARDTANVVVFTVRPGTDNEPGSLHLFARSPELGDGKQEISAIVEGEELRIAFNVKWLREYLVTVTDAERIKIELNGHMSPGAFRPVGQDNQVYILMPMHLAGQEKKETEEESEETEEGEE